jgi:hypothetical protein
LRNQLIATPGTERTGERLDRSQAVGTDRQSGYVVEGGATKTAIGGEKRGEEALGDKT